MTQEEKQLLLRDLSARLPYGVKFHYTKHPQSNVDQDCDGTAIGYYCNLIVSANDNDFCADRCKLYLRPMSSMTEEEKKIMRSCGFELISYDTGCIGFANIENCIDEVSFKFMEEFLNSHHFDYRELIEKGLAIEAPENMYKTE